MTLIRSDDACKVWLATNIGFYVIGLVVTTAIQNTLIGRWCVMSAFIWLGIAIYALALGHFMARPVGFTAAGLGGYWVMLALNGFLGWLILHG
jgi:hypothetical protein